MIMIVPKTLIAYKNKDRDDTPMIFALKISPVIVYFADIGYEWNRKREGYTTVEEYKGPNGKVILKQSPEPDAEEFKRLRHEWEFSCPHDEADMHIGNLKQIYRKLGFEIDE